MLSCTLKKFVENSRGLATKNDGDKEETFGCDGYVYYLNCDNGSRMYAYVRTIKSYTLNTCNSFVYQL